MGIRFECPNGHRLNVKAFLAGKRGICPDCDAKFIVPEVSGGRAALVGSVESQDSQSAPVHVPAETPSIASPPPLVPSEALPTTIDQALPDVWYVRPTSGEQYGPANSELMRSWVADDRVPHDSWVWRTGWDKWKIASEALEIFDAVPVAATAPTAPSTSPGIDIGEHSPEESFSSRLKRSQPGSRRERARKLSIALGTLVLLLSVALVLVLWIQK